MNTSSANFLQSSATAHFSARATGFGTTTQTVMAATVPAQPSIVPASALPSGTTGTMTSSGRLRQQSRKKAALDADNVYRVESAVTNAAGSKRAAGHEKADTESRKRKRIDHAATFQSQPIAPATSSSGAGGGKQVAGKPDGEGQTTLFDFATLPTASLYRYIIHHDLVPAIFPTPLGAEDPPPPTVLLDPARMAPRAPSPGTGLLGMYGGGPRGHGRRVREKEGNRRRSTRLLEEEMRVAGEEFLVPVLADVGEVHGTLAVIAERHFRESSVREVDTLATFMCAVKAKGGRWRP